MPRFDHQYTIAFTIKTDIADPFEVPADELRDALLRSLAERDKADDWAEAFGPIDTVEIDD